MKKIALLLLTLSSISLANDKPPHISEATQHLNYIITSPSQRYMNLKENNQTLSASIDAAVSETYNIIDIPLAFVYKDTFGVAIYLPYVESKFASQKSQRGTGDVTTEFSYNLGQLQDDIPLENNILGLRYTFDNGDETKGLGMGMSSVSIFWDSTYIVDEDWTFLGSLMWTFYLDDVEINGKKYSGGDEDVLWFGIENNALYEHKLTTSLKLNWWGKYNSIPKYSDAPKPSYDIVDATLQVESSKLMKNTPLKAGIKLPLWSTSSVNNELMFFVGISKYF